jgi:SAM-dependent methyltransferase
VWHCQGEEFGGCRIVVPGWLRLPFDVAHLLSFLPWRMVWHTYSKIAPIAAEARETVANAVSPSDGPIRWASARLCWSIMSHPELYGFFKAVVDANKSLVAGANVLEIGAYDANGSVRGLFSSAANYVGVDLQEGPGVDLVSFGHEINHPDECYDITISGECFEHDPYWGETFQNMTRMTRLGGLVAFSCASLGRLEHGTSRTDWTASPGSHALGIDYYRNLTEADFDELPLASMFSKWRFWYLPTHFDLYFVGAKIGETDVNLPSDEAIRNLRRLMPLSDRLARLPMRLLARNVSPARYQSIILPIWTRRLPG